MAPKSFVEVRSESWLNLTEVQLNKNRNNSQQANSVSRHSLGSCQLRETAAAISKSSLSSNNKNEHLLIRLRQQSYLNRSSNSLSSNLSNSIDLSPSLIGLKSEKQASSYYDTPFEAGEEENSYCQSDINLRKTNEFSEPLLSTKSYVLKEEPRRLKYFRNRLQSKQRLQHQSNYLQNPRENESPLMRSLSSFSEKLNGKFTNFRHSWKHFLYNYNHNHFESVNDKEDSGKGRSKEYVRQSINSSKFQQKKQQFNRNNIVNNKKHQNNRHSEFINRRQLTNDWLERYHGTEVGSPDSKMRPKSLEISLQEQLQETATEFNHRQQRQKLKQDLENRNVSNVYETNCLNSCNKLGESLPQTNHNHTRDTPSSTTLVIALTSSNNSPSSTCLESNFGSNLTLNSRDQDNTQQSEPMEMNNNNLTSAYNLSNTKQIQDNNADLMLPTSDYWSTVASNDYKQQQQQQVEIENISIINTQQAMFVADQEYYLDVANAAAAADSSSASFPDTAQQQIPSALLNDNHVIPISPPLINLTTAAATTTSFTNLHPIDHRLLNSAAAINEDYDDYAVPADENCRLDRSQVELIQMIGEGQKGYVFLGKLQSKDGHTIQDVAIKTLKYETGELIDKLMREAAMMRQFEHPHIIKFIGVCPETPALIAMELAEFGEIKQYLKLNKHLIQVSKLILFTFQISTALSYLESKQYVHRDVAARNVLVCSHNCVKLADFGLSRNLSSPTTTVTKASQQQQNKWLNNSSSPHSLVDDSSEKNNYVAASKGKLPVRWLAPESLAFRRFTSASDVWMFAVCSWEFFHYGQLRPWAQIRNNQVLMAIELGQRLAKPPNCPTRLYQLMLQCWSYAPIQRPKFREVKQSLWSIYLNERAREQLEIEQLELQELQERKQNQERLMLLMNKRQSNRILAEQQRLVEQHKNFEDLANRNQQFMLLQQQQQYRQQRIDSISPISPVTTSYTPGNASGYSSTTATTAEHSNNSSRSSSMGSLARNKAKLASLRQAPAILASGSNKNNFFQLKMTDFNPIVTSPPPPKIINDQQQQVCLANEAQRLSAIKEKDGRHKKVVGANLRRFQRVPGYVLQKQRSQGSIMGDNFPNDNIDLNDVNLVLGEGNTSKHQQRRYHQAGYDDCALLASSAKSKQNRRQLMNDLQIRVEDNDADADEDSNSETETTTAVNVRKVVNNMERLTLMSQTKTPEPAYEGLQQVLMDRQQEIKPNSKGYTVLNHSWGIDNDTSGWPSQDNRQVLLAKQQHMKPDQSQKKRSKERSSEPRRVNDVLQSLKISPMKAKLAYNDRQASLAEAPNRPGGEFLVGKQQERRNTSKGTIEERMADMRQVSEKESQIQQQQEQLALHQRLLGHIRPASSCKSSGRRSANLSNQKVNGGKPSNEVLTEQPSTKVETVDQSLQILESLITDESQKSDGRRSVVPSCPISDRQQQQMVSQQRGGKNKNGLLMENDSEGNKNNRYNVATTHARLLGLATPPPANFSPDT